MDQMKRFKRFKCMNWIMGMSLFNKHTRFTFKGQIFFVGKQMWIQ